MTELGLFTVSLTLITGNRKVHKIFLSAFDLATPFPAEGFETFVDKRVFGNGSSPVWVPGPTYRQFTFLGKRYAVFVKTISASIDIDGAAKGMVAELGPESFPIHRPFGATHPVGADVINGKPALNDLFHDLFHFVGIPHADLKFGDTGDVHFDLVFPAHRAG